MSKIKNCLNSEYTQPFISAAASLFNMCGAMAAVSVGADRTEDGKVNPFFYVAFTTSSLYFLANAGKVVQIYCNNKQTFAEKELARRECELDRLV